MNHELSKQKERKVKKRIKNQKINKTDSIICENFIKLFICCCKFEFFFHLGTKFIYENLKCIVINENERKLVEKNGNEKKCKYKIRH